LKAVGDAGSRVGVLVSLLLVGVRVTVGRGVGVQVGIGVVGLGVGVGAVLGGRIITTTLQIMLPTTTRLRIHR